MTVPLITHITPSTVPTGGGLLLEIAGDGFRLPTAVPAAGATMPPPPSVRVAIAGTPSRDVRVLSSESLVCVLPSGGPGPVDVVVENLDADGTPVAGERAVAHRVLTYVRPGLTSEADLTRLVRAALQELKRQVLANVVLTVQTDFDVDTGDELHLSHVAELPALVLIGPELSENRFFSLNELPESSIGEDQFVQRRTPYTVDLGFTLVGVSDHTSELLNLMAATQLFFHRNPFLELDRDAVDAGAGRVRYEMDFTPDGDLKVTSQPNESNVRSFSGRFVVRGFDLEELAGAADGSVVGRGAVVRDVALEGPQPLTPRRPGDVKPER